MLLSDVEARTCQRLAFICVLTGLSMPAVASANPEPTAYDTRSVSMGLAGTTFIERSSALVLNPANLEGIWERLSKTYIEAFETM